jgi:hypothetical protein
LNGIEINENAVEMMENFYSEMMGQIYDAPNIIISSIEDKIKEFSNNSFDVIFTFAVLMHIHTSSEWIFEEMKRIAKHYICIVEDLSRDWIKIFCGKFELIKIIKCSSHIDIKDKFRMFVFERKGDYDD